MISWINEYSTVINAVSNAGMLLVWVFYAQLLYSSYSRQQRGRILISQVQGNDLDSTCILSNMSKEPIHIECIMVFVQGESISVSRDITDFLSDTEIQSSADPGSITHRGPLESSDFMSLGTFRYLIKRAMQPKPDQPSLSQERLDEESIKKIRFFEIRIVAQYGPSNHPVGARHRFEVFMQENDENKIIVEPSESVTKQLYSRWNRHFTIRKWLDDCRKAKQQR